MVLYQINEINVRYIHLKLSKKQSNQKVETKLFFNLTITENIILLSDMRKVKLVCNINNISHKSRT